MAQETFRINRQGILVSCLSLLGGVVDFYDLSIVGLVAILVWPGVFFNGISPAFAVGLGIATTAATSVARFFGATLFGHFGDRIGRKTVLIWTLFVAGIVSFVTAGMPTYAQIGIAAPISIFVLRIVQGLGLGGEWGGSATWISEFFPTSSKLRSFFASFVTLGSVLGNSLGAALITFFAVYYGHSFASFGWRVPFIIGGTVAIVGFVARYATRDSPLFTKLVESRRVVKYPSLSVWKSQSKTLIPFTLLALGVSSGAGFGFLGFGYYTAYAHAIGFSTPTLTGIAAVATPFSIPLGLGGGLIAALMGKKKAVTLALAFSFLTPILSIEVTKTSYPNVFPVLLLDIITVMMFYFGLSIWPSYFAESLPTEFRFSGAGQIFGMSTMIGGLYGLLSPYILAAYGVLGAWPIFVGIAMGLAALGGIMILFTKETKNVSLSSDLDAQKAVPAG